jgi:hypothetical protein
MHVATAGNFFACQPDYRDMRKTGLPKPSRRGKRISVMWFNPEKQNRASPSRRVLGRRKKLPRQTRSLPRRCVICCVSFDHARKAEWGRVADLVRQLAVAFSAQKLTQQEFVDELLSLEAARMTPAGLTLSVSDTPDEWTSVLIKESHSGRVCSAFEFLPDERRFRPFSQLYRYVSSVKRAGFSPAG